MAIDGRSMTVDYAHIPRLPADVFVAPLSKPAYLGADWLEPSQRDYLADEHRLWDELFARQMRLLPERACREFMRGLERLELGRGGVPELAAINSRLRTLTGWEVVPVPMLIPDHVFFIIWPTGAFRQATSCVRASSWITSRNRMCSTTCSVMYRC